MNPAFPLDEFYLMPGAKEVCVEYDDRVEEENMQFQTIEE